jgi:hypothetical protein
VLRVVLVQRRGRLVEDEELDVLGERLRDLDELLLADAEVLDLRVGVFAQSDARQQVDGAQPRL